MIQKLNYIDLFAGCGGLSDGIEQTGKYNFLASVEWEKNAVLTMRNRMLKKWNISDANNRVAYFDIQRIDELLNGWNDEFYGKNDGFMKLVADKSVDVIFGGPPCQAYSVAGRIRDKDKMQNDYRNYLFESYMKIVTFFKPKAFVFENVPGMLSATPGGIPVVDRIRSRIEECGYRICDNLKNVVFNVRNFGVPQDRNRVIIFGINSDIALSKDLIKNFYQNLHSHAVPHKVATVADAIFDLEKFEPIEPIGRKSHVKTGKGKSVSNHDPRYHNKRDIKIFKMLAEDIETGNNEFTSIEALKKIYTKFTGRTSKIHKYNVLKPNKPANTIPAHLHKDGLRHIHPDSKQARTISVREAARLQAFDDDFVFISSQGENYKMIGNAVPPLFSKIIANTVYSTLLNNEVYK